MILSGKEIEKRLGNDICIDPFDDSKLNPNSYNLSLHDELVVYTTPFLDMAEDNPHKTIKIPKSGLTIYPGELYLGRTEEYTETYNLVPLLEGRSSIGRLGMTIHVTAGFGDVGFQGFWTLEISCVKPVVIYPFVDICQIYYLTIDGNYDPYPDSGKYQKNVDIQTSKLFKEFKEKYL